MQRSFAKIQDLIDYVCEYMLMRPKPTYKATYECRLFVMIWMKIKLLLASANSIPGPVLLLYRCTESEYISSWIIVNSNITLNSIV